MATTGRVLIVDDEVEVTDVLQVMLGRLGYVTAVAGSGAAALRLQADYRPDVVLLDLALPEMSGDVIMQRLRQADPRLPFVVMTGDPDHEVAHRALAQGAIGCIGKPFRIAQLAELLKTALAAGGTSRGGTATNG
jgi:CheY-like chemotaxis protein